MPDAQGKDACAAFGTPVAASLATAVGSNDCDARADAKMEGVGAVIPARWQDCLTRRFPDTPCG